MKTKIFLLCCLVITIAAGYIYYHLFYSLQNKYLTKEQKSMVKNIPYSIQISNLKKEKNKLYEKYKTANKKEKTAIINKGKILFVEQLSNHIFPYWYGTGWAFHGTAEIPQQGQIACGYFVTTTLRAMDFPLNRGALACMASEQMIKNLTQNKYIYHISNTSIDIFENKIKEIGKGLYIAGLDKHTGFLLYNDDGLFFIHSGGKYPCHVRKENVSNCQTLINSKYKVVGRISEDEQFILKWLKE